MQQIQAVIEGAGWAVVACQVRRENETARWLQYFGSLVYLPKREIEIKATRYLTSNQRHRGLLRKVLRPLFPGYFFVANMQVDPRDIPGLCRLLHGRAINHAVDTLKAAGDGDLIRMPKIESTPEYGIGDVVQVTDGPFAAFGGIIVEIMPARIDQEGRIRADIDLFGRSTPVELFSDQIKVVARARHPDCRARAA